MTTSLQAISTAVFFRNKNFGSRIFKTQDGRGVFLQVGNSPYPKKKQCLVNLRSFFNTYNFFPGRRCFFLLVFLNRMVFEKETDLQLPSTKRDSISRKSTDFGFFWLPRSSFKVGFPNIEENFQSTPVKFLGKVPSNIVLKFEICSLKKFEGARAVLKVDFQKS